MSNFDLSLDDEPVYNDFGRCGECSWAALYFDGSAHVSGLSCYYVSHNPAVPDIRQPDDMCNKV